MVPVELRDAYYWVESAGQIDEFLDMSSVDAARYADEATENFSQARLDGPEWAWASVTVDHLLALRNFLLLRRAAEEDAELQEHLENQMDNPFYEER